MLNDEEVVDKCLKFENLGLIKRMELNNCDNFILIRKNFNVKMLIFFIIEKFQTELSKWNVLDSNMLVDVKLSYRLIVYYSDEMKICIDYEKIEIWEEWVVKIKGVQVLELNAGGSCE